MLLTTVPDLTSVPVHPAKPRRPFANDKLAREFDQYTLPTPVGEPRIIRESSACRCTFNVMPEKSVDEVLRIKEYRAWDNYVEGVFDREYSSSMLRSPQHLVMLTTLAHVQKLAYVWACHHFGFDYDPFGLEKVKFWWTRTNIRLPGLITQEHDVVQWFHVPRIQRVSDTTYHLLVASGVGDGAFISAETPMYII